MRVVTPIASKDHEVICKYSSFLTGLVSFLFSCNQSSMEADVYAKNAPAAILKLQTEKKEAVAIAEATPIAAFQRRNEANMIAQTEIKHMNSNNTVLCSSFISIL